MAASPGPTGTSMWTRGLDGSLQLRANIFGRIRDDPNRCAGRRLASGHSRSHPVPGRQIISLGCRDQPLTSKTTEAANQRPIAQRAGVGIGLASMSTTAGIQVNAAMPRRTRPSRGRRMKGRSNRRDHTLNRLVGGRPPACQQG